MRKVMLFSLFVMAALPATLPLAATAMQQALLPGTIANAGTVEVLPTLPVLLPAAGGANDTGNPGIRMATTRTAGSSATPGATTSEVAKTGSSGPALRASRILRAAVIDQAGSEIGQVDNLLVDSGTGCVRYAVVTGGTAGTELGERASFVPWSLLTLSTKQNAFVLGAGAEALAGAPGFERYTTWPSLSTPGWDGQVRAYWQRFSANGRLEATCGVTTGAVAAGTATPQATNGAGTPGTPSAGQVNVTLQEFAIVMPGTIPAGPTNFFVTNAGTLPHNFEITGQGLDQKFSRSLAPGESVSMGANLAPGSYQVFCPVDKHRGQGMQVQLTVTATGGLQDGSPTPGSLTTAAPGNAGVATPGDPGRDLAAPTRTPGPDATPAATLTDNPPGMAGAATPGSLPGLGAGTPAGGPASDTGLVRITQLTGYRLLAADGQPLGSLVDMVLSPASGQVLYVAASAAQSRAQAAPGTPPSTAPSSSSPATPPPLNTSISSNQGQGNSSPIILIPWSALAADNSAHTLTIQTAADQVARAPSFSRLHWPDLTALDWDRGLRGFWQGLGVTLGAIPAQGTPGSANTPSAAATGAPALTTGGTPGASGAFPSGWLASTQNIVGAAVQDAAGKDLGHISDLVADLASGSVTYAVLSRGGFLGLGGQAIAVPWSALAFDPVQQAYRLNVEQTVLDRAPAFDQQSLDGGSPSWDANAHSYWESQGLPASGTDTGPAPGTRTPGPTNVPSSLPFAIAGSSAVRVNRLVGYRVKTVNGVDVGEVVSLALGIDNRGPGNSEGAGATETPHVIALTGTPTANANVSGTGAESSAATTGQILYVLVGRGGILGLGQQIVPVPWPLFTISEVNRTFTLKADEQTFRQAPAVDPNALATAQSRDWDAGVRAYWAGILP